MELPRSRNDSPASAGVPATFPRQPRQSIEWRELRDDLRNQRSGQYPPRARRRHPMLLDNPRRNRSTRACSAPSVLLLARTQPASVESLADPPGPPAASPPPRFPEIQPPIRNRQPLCIPPPRQLPETNSHRNADKPRSPRLDPQSGSLPDSISTALENAEDRSQSPHRSPRIRSGRPFREAPWRIGLLPHRSSEPSPGSCFEMEVEQRDRHRRHPRYPSGLAQRGRPDARQFLLDLPGQP